MRAFVLFLIVFNLSFNAPILLAKTQSQVKKETQLKVKSKAKKKSNKKAKRKKKSKHSQVGIVSTSGAAVYERQTFDAPIRTYLQAGKKVLISKKKYEGIGGFGSFYKIRVSKNLTGYISDVDVIPRFAKKRGQKKIQENPIFDEAQDMRRPRQEPIYYSRYIGAGISTIKYSEKFEGVKLGANTNFLGFRMSGPGAVFDDVPLDLELYIALSPPSYYQDLATSGTPSGFIILTNLSLMFSLMEMEDFLLYYSLGLHTSYSKINVLIKSNSTGSDVNFDSRELKLGAVAGLGPIFRFKRNYLIKADVKFYYEKTSYWGYGVAFQAFY